MSEEEKFDWERELLDLIDDIEAGYLDFSKLTKKALEYQEEQYKKELQIADERWKRAELHHKEKHESDTEICNH